MSANDLYHYSSSFAQSLKHSGRVDEQAEIYPNDADVLSVNGALCCYREIAAAVEVLLEEAGYLLEDQHTSSNRAAQQTW
eukprot:3850361-Amphidinium_carterae.3